MPAAESGSSRPRVGAWCLYDFANSSFTTLVVTFVYPVYFTGSVVGDAASGDRIWSWAVSLSFLAVALLSPVIGAYVDASGRRRPALVGLSLLCVAATALLALQGPGRWPAAFALFLVANFAFESSQALYNAYLPEIAPPGSIGRISGYAWGLGYAGGLVCLVIGLTMTGLPDGAGGWRLAPWLPTEAGWNVRATNLLVAGWFLLFATPLFLVPAGRRTGPGALAATFHNLASTVRALARYRHAARFLLARLIYNDGLVTVFSFGGIYAARTFGMSFGEIILLGIWLNVVAGLGAAAFGHLDDRIGGRRTVLATLVVLMASALLGAATSSRALFWVAATGIGLMVGPNQAASRSLMGRFAPGGRTGEFYGFFAFSGKLSAVMGPLAWGQVTSWTGSQRWGMVSVLAFLAAGLGLLLGVDEEAGIAAARAPAAAGNPRPGAGSV